MAKAKNTVKKVEEVVAPEATVETTVEGTTTIDGITSLNPVVETVDEKPTTEPEQKEIIIVDPLEAPENKSQEKIIIKELTDEEKDLTPKIEVEELTVEEAEVFIDKSFLKKLQRVKNEYIFSMNMTGNYKMALAIEKLDIRDYRSEDAIKQAINDLSK